ncbi:MAG TPA: YiiG family protein [Hyphomicrobiaceae bacterium]|nr:YiiG family protein [Hyphomicrobiaceae bacterium]
MRLPLMLLAALTLVAEAPHVAAQTTDDAALTKKINAYVGCINRLSARAFDSRQRYFSWAQKSGPTGKERIIYGLYTIYDTKDCAKSVEAANALEPRETDIEAAASTYVAAVTALEPLLKEADDYYTQQDYKDDKMAKGRALHPRLVAAWDAFGAADSALRARIDQIQEKRAIARIAEIERTEGKNARYHIEELMLRAKQVMRVQGGAKPDVAAIAGVLGDYEAIVKATEAFVAANPDNKIGSSFLSSAKTFLTTSKQLMRRIRDKVPYSQGDKMMLATGSGAWMVEGSPARQLRDYNSLVDAYNRGGRF